jgi:ATP/maltotriose-dependent transcriptional regulator MalT
MDHLLSTFNQFGTNGHTHSHNNGSSHHHGLPPIDLLTQREQVILELIATGLSRKEIATHLYVSLNTVKTHTQNLYNKLQVHSRTQAVAQAKQLGLLSHLVSTNGHNPLLTRPHLMFK